MSDAPFWRPGARPAPHRGTPAEPRVEQPRAAPVEMTENEPSETDQAASGGSAPNSWLRRRAAPITAALLVGLAIGVLLVPKPGPGPLEITLDNFPAEVLEVMKR